MAGPGSRGALVAALLVLAITGAQLVSAQSSRRTVQNGGYTCTIRNGDDRLLRCEETSIGSSGGAILDLSNEQISSVENGAFNGLGNLHELSLSRNQISSVENGTFTGLGNLTYLDLHSNQISRIENGDFTGLGNLDELFLYENRISSVKNGVFTGLGNLHNLGLYENRISSVENGAFNGLGNLRSLSLSSNQISSVENGTFTGLGNLTYLALETSQISRIENGAFTGLGNLRELFLQNNQISSVENGAFTGLGHLQELFLQNNRLSSVESGTFAGLGDLRILHVYANRIAAAAFGEISAGLEVFQYNPNPLRCLRQDSTTTCDECVQGYVPRNTSTTGSPGGLACYQPVFGLAPHSSRAEDNVTDLLAHETRLPHNLVQGQALPSHSFNLSFLEDRRASFVGFRGDPSGITFELDFGPRLGIGCGRTAVGNTNEQPGRETEFQTGVEDESETRFRSPEHNLEFSVATTGTFGFYGCESQSATHFAIYNRTNRTDVIAAVRASMPLWSDSNLASTSSMSYYTSTGVRTPNSSHQCELGVGYNWTVSIPDPGDYVLVVQGLYDDPGDSSADYEVRMTCHGTANTASTDPGGIVIDPRTGNITGAPETPGDFVARINAVDATGARIMVHEWNFAVDLKPRLTLNIGNCSTDWTGRLTEALVGGSPGADPGKFDVNTTVLLPGYDSLASTCTLETLFTGYSAKTEGDPDIIFFYEMVGASGDAAGLPTGDSLWNSNTGRAALQLGRIGGVTIRLVARSGLDTAEVFNHTVNVQLPDAHGNDGSDTAAVVVGAVLGTIVALMLAVLVAFRTQVYRLKHRPVDTSAMQLQVMQTLGLVASTDIGAEEHGITLIFNRALPAAFGVELPQQFKSDLTAALQKSAPSIKSALAAARITATPGSNRVLVVMQQRTTKTGSSTAETAVEQLLRRVKRSELTVGELVIVDANVAVPQRVPREIPRLALTRIKLLGEGAFGAVHQCQLKEKSAAMGYFVAVKSIRAGAAGVEQARAELLREAALGALLDHRNVVATVGVCTVPRDVPSLLLLAFYAESTLERLCSAATPDSMQVSERLTYCAQVLQGLQYIGARRIVHRDVAARNVLLDSTMTCKVSDFGMAAALQEGGKEYIRSDEQLAVRWCSIEVAREGKYSVQSDVWAFGVLAYEVFACGVLPYADRFDNLTEISNFVKEGGKLGQPNAQACPVEVYLELLLPCFAADPVDRPAFGELYEVAVKHGAEEDDEALAERVAQRQAHGSTVSDATHNAVRSGKDTALVSAKDLALLGPSIHHLESALLPALHAALTPKWSTTLNRGDATRILNEAAVPGGFLVRPSSHGGGGTIGKVVTVFEGGGIHNFHIEARDSRCSMKGSQFWFDSLNELVEHYMAENADAYFKQHLVTIPNYGGPDAPAYSYKHLAHGDPAEATIWTMVHAYAKPVSAEVVCPRDGRVGCAYVDTLVNEGDVGRANALLSYSWGYLVAEVTAALSAWAKRQGRDPKRTRIWICSLCLNQFRMADNDVEQDLQKEFGDRVVALGHILPMLEPWDDPGYVKRAWCLFELYTAIQRRSEVEIDIILSPSQAKAFHDRINQDGTDADAIDGALSGIRSEDAEASVQADLDAIRALIKQYSGGFGTLNDTVKQYLRRWFVSQGGIKVVARQRGAKTAGPTSGNAKYRTAERIARQPITTTEETGHARTNHGVDGFGFGFGFDMPAKAAVIDGGEGSDRLAQARGRKGTLADIDLDTFAEQSRSGGGSANYGASSDGSFG